MSKLCILPFIKCEMFRYLTKFRPNSNSNQSQSGIWFGLQQFVWHVHGFRVSFKTNTIRIEHTLKIAEGSVNIRNHYHFWVATHRYLEYSTKKFIISPVGQKNCEQVSPYFSHKGVENCQNLHHDVRGISKKEEIYIKSNNVNDVFTPAPSILLNFIMHTGIKHKQNIEVRASQS